MMTQPYLNSIHIDPLTGVYARIGLGERLQTEVIRSTRYQLQFTVFMLDLDHFKSVNDAFGHRRGDQVLAEVGQRLIRAVRKADEVYRYGGDEFVILLPHTDLDQAVGVAERVLREVNDAAIPGDPPVSITLSIGCAAFPQDADTAEMLFEVADRRHSQAKRLGRARIVFKDIDHPTNRLLAAPSRLIDREDAIYTLGNFLNSLPVQKYGLLQVAGPPGMGRTRFLEEVQNAARLRGYGVFSIRGTAALKSRWMGAVVEAQQGWESWPSVLTQGYALAAGLQDWLGMKGRQGILLTIDALDEIDRQSFGIIADILRDPQVPQFAAVYTGGDDHLLRSIWVEYPLKDIISLGPLSEAGLQIWARHSLNWEAPTEFIAWLYTQTAGEPARIQRGLSWLIRQNIIQDRPGGWQLQPNYAQLDLGSHLNADQITPTNLAAYLPTFIGRIDEIQQLKDSIREQRLVTVVGPGGIGKTSLATQTAVESLPDFPDGVYFVPLTSGTGDEFILTAIAEAMSIKYSGSGEAFKQLLNRFGRQKILLALDNFEDLVEEAPLLSEFLAGAPGLHILVTSRSPLHVPEETILELGGLPYPHETREDISGYSAVQLFLHAASQVSPEFTPSSEDAAALVRICQLVEGMPLGLELAASSISMFTCQQIVGEVEERLAFLSSERPDLPVRHRSMIAIFDSFWGILSEVERGVLANLSVFRGGFSARAAQEVAGASRFFIESLVKMLFLHRLPNRRFTMHALLNQYAAEKIRMQPQIEQQLRERHCDYFVNFLKTNAAQFHSDRSHEAFDRILVEIENLRAAWEWIVHQNDLKRMEQVLPGLNVFLDSHGWFREMLGILSTIKSRLLQARKDLPPDVQRDIFLVNVLIELGDCYYHLGIYTDGREQLKLALEVLAPLDRPAEAASVIQRLANNMRQVGEYEEAIALLRQGLPIAQKCGDRVIESNYINSLGVTLYFHGQTQASLEYFERCLEIARELDDAVMLARTLNNMGDACFDLQNYPRARQLSLESLAVLKDENKPTLRCDILRSLVKIAYTERNYTEAVHHLIQALQIVVGIDAAPLEIALWLMSALLWEQQGKSQQALDLARLIRQQPSTPHDILDGARQLIDRLAGDGGEGFDSGQKRPRSTSDASNEHPVSQLSGGSGQLNLHQVTAEIIAQLKQ